LIGSKNYDTKAQNDDRLKRDKGDEPVPFMMEVINIIEPLKYPRIHSNLSSTQEFTATFQVHKNTSQLFVISEVV
jgi:hypothetical protein